MASTYRIGEDSRSLTGWPRTGTQLPASVTSYCTDHSGHCPGQPHMLVFYRGHWCAHCREQLVELGRSAYAFEQLGVAIAVISTDDPDGIAAMRALTGATFTILSDPEGVLIKELNLVDPFEFGDIPVSLPAVFLVDGSGVVQYHYVGSAPDDRPRMELLKLAAEQIAGRK